jgi:hypothetical protein
MDNTHITQDSEWAHLCSMLPGDLEQSCLDKLAIGRFREIRSASDLLRLCFAYGVCDLSLRQAAAWASTSGLAQLSDVAVFKRLRSAGDWLGYLILQWFEERGVTREVPALSVRIVDGSSVATPGRKADDYRLHMAFDLAQMRMVDVELTSSKEGESLARHTICPGEVVLADRGYGKRPQIAYVLSRKGHVVVRIHMQTMPLETRQGKPVDMLALFETLDEHELGDWPVCMQQDGQAHPMRLIAVKKTREAAEKSIQQAKRKAQQNGRKPDPRFLKAAWYTYVLTDLTKDQASAAQVLELYRLRWQIELAFKRIKSLLHLDLRAKNPGLVRTYIFANILATLMIEELSGNALSFFPWGFRLSTKTRQPLATI